MARASFDDYVFPLDHPQVARLKGKDARAHARAARGDPVVQELLIGPWSRLLTEPFTGITTDGTPVQGLFELKPDGAPVAEMVSAARRLLGLLGDEDRKALLRPLDAREWRMWNNTEIYFFVYGLRMDEISPDLRNAICDVMRVSLSEHGYGKTRHAMWLNGFLGDLTDAPAILGEWSFNFTLFGEPSDQEPWGWQLAGHHVALNCVIVDGQMVTSPTFLGAEPNWAPQGPYGDAVLFADEERMGAELMASLSPELRRQAVVYDLLKDPAMPPGRWHKADQRHLGGAFRDNRVIPHEGVPVSAFSRPQRERLMELVGEFLVLPAGPRAGRLAEIRRHLDDTHFCWIGATDGEQPFYYRIQSPVIMIEFDQHAGVFLSNSEPERFHIHTIVRTPNGNDYGMDLLRMHYAQAHPGHSPGRLSRSWDPPAAPGSASCWRRAVRGEREAMLIYSMSVSVDGFIADREGGFGWTLPDEEQFRFHLAQTRELGGYLCGRRLYETMLVWETDPSMREVELGAAFADVWCAIPKVVFSRTLDSVRGNARLAEASVADEVAAALDATHKDVSIGGAGLAAAAIVLGLVDELRMFRNPVVVGGGTPFLPPVTEDVRLDLIETRTFGSRVIYERYMRARDPA